MTTVNRGLASPGTLSGSVPAGDAFGRSSVCPTAAILRRLYAMLLRVLTIGWLVIAVGCAASSRSSELAGPSRVELAGLSLPQRVAGREARWIGVTPEGIVEFNYFAEERGAPGFSVRFPPSPPVLDSSELRERAEADRSGFLRSPMTRDRATAGPVERMVVMGMDEVEYGGWCARMWHRGSRLLQWICYFEKQDRLVMFYVLDDNFSPVVTESLVRELVSGALGGLAVSRTPA